MIAFSENKKQIGANDGFTQSKGPPLAALWRHHYPIYFVWKLGTMCKLHIAHCTLYISIKY